MHVSQQLEGHAWEQTLSPEQKAIEMNLSNGEPENFEVQGLEDLSGKCICWAPSVRFRETLDEDFRRSSIEDFRVLLRVIEEGGNRTVSRCYANSLSTVWRGGRRLSLRPTPLICTGVTKSLRVDASIGSGLLQAPPSEK